MKLLDETGSRRRVWLTSFWGFRPETWGCIGFTRPQHRNHFVRRFLDDTESPGLVAIYVTTTAPNEFAHMRGKIVGVMEMTGVLGDAEEFIDLANEPFVKKDLDAGRWRHSVQASRAWRLKTYLPVAEAAPHSYSPARARYIGAQGVELTETEAATLLDAAVMPANIFRGR